jgi:hypothetical protein
MPQGRRHRHAPRPSALLTLLLLGGCTSVGDLGRLQQPLVADNIHAWVGQEAATHVGAPISSNNLTDDERTLRDLAYPLIEPPYDRRRWDEVLYEYGLQQRAGDTLWVADPTDYYRHLLAAEYRSTAGRYNLLIDDIRNDVVRIGPFFELAHRVIDLDHKRQATMDLLPDVPPPERADALARIGENYLTVVWVQNSLAQRCAGYRFALNHLVVSEPANAAAQADVALTLLQQQIAANQPVAPPRIAAAPRTAAVVK